MVRLSPPSEGVHDTWVSERVWLCQVQVNFKRSCRHDLLQHPMLAYLDPLSAHSNE